MQSPKTEALTAPIRETAAREPEKGSRRDMYRNIGGVVAGQKLNGHGITAFTRMHTADGKFKPETAAAVVVGNSIGGTIALKKRSISASHGSSFKKLARAARVAHADPNARFMTTAENPHVHPRSKRVAATG